MDAAGMSPSASNLGFAATARYSVTKASQSKCDTNGAVESLILSALECNDDAGSSGGESTNAPEHGNEMGPIMASTWNQFIKGAFRNLSGTSGHLEKHRVQQNLNQVMQEYLASSAEICKYFGQGRGYVFQFLQEVRNEHPKEKIEGICAGLLLLVQPPSYSIEARLHAGRILDMLSWIAREKLEAELAENKEVKYPLLHCAVM
jgi:hypothetical protein